mgnify:FL=1
MRKKMFALILILPLLVMFLIYGVGNNISLLIDMAPDYIRISYEDGEELLLAEGQNEFELKAQVYPRALKNRLVWSCTPNEKGEQIAQVDGDRLIVSGEGLVTLTCVQQGTSVSASVRVFLLRDGVEARYIYVSDGINGANSPSLGVYDIENKTLVPAVQTLRIRVLPSSADQTVEIETGDGETVLAEGQYDLPVEAGEHRITIRTPGDTASTEYTYRAVEGGVNVYTYDDLLLCTNRWGELRGQKDTSRGGEVVVLRRNLESAANQEQTDTALFGRESADGVACEYETLEAGTGATLESGHLFGYDTEYYTRVNADKSSNCTIKVGIHFKNHVYGNGFTLNAHELAFPSDELAGNAVAGADDPFQGPLMFVSAGGLTVYGQDNAGFLLDGDGLIMDDIVLKNCNNVDNLSDLNFVGTVLELAGNNISLTDCKISNGRTVVRSFSNENLRVESCLLQYAREFIFKLGSNRFVRTPQSIGNFADFETFAKLVRAEDGSYLSDSSAEIINTYFATCGIFSIGVEAHFNGIYLRDYFKDPKLNLAGVSWQSRLSLKGDVRFYDWKTIEGLDSTTLISGSNHLVKFDIRDIIQKVGTDESRPDFCGKIIREYNGKAYVHGGVAFYGGGQNVSVLDLSEYAGYSFLPTLEVDLTDPAFGYPNAENILTLSAGYGPFRFYMYPNSNAAITPDTPVEEPPSYRG